MHTVTPSITDNRACQTIYKKDNLIRERIAVWALTSLLARKTNMQSRANINRQGQTICAINENSNMMPERHEQVLSCPCIDG